MLAVDKALRKRGIGRWLIREATQAMRVSGCEEAVLEAEVTNHGAIALYEGATPSHHCASKGGWHISSEVAPPPLPKQTHTHTPTHTHRPWFRARQALVQILSQRQRRIPPQTVVRPTARASRGRSRNPGVGRGASGRTQRSRDADGVSALPHSGPQPGVRCGT